ncbi:MAG: phosphohydrolase [Thermodesulfovibrio sp.]|nr:phosphohydrolase [Thermodesulfovibrio sp.]
MVNSSVPLSDLVLAIAGTVDLVDEQIAGHHTRVAFIASEIAAALGLSETERAEIVQAGVLHDIGALSLRERLGIMEFEAENVDAHQVVGYRLLSMFGRFRNTAEIVRHHHASFADSVSRQLPLGSHILNLADRVAVLMPQKPNILAEVPGIRDRISAGAGKAFMPAVVEVFMDLADKESFWLDAISLPYQYLKEKIEISDAALSGEELLEFARLVSKIIDFKSRFTAVHSCGVSSSAEALAGFSGFGAEDLRTMKIAGYLHDIGKLAVPSEIIEKPESLDFAEYGSMRRHTFYTHRVLSRINGFETITEWAALHHERLDGTGYPFHIGGNRLSLGSRIMAVADVFTALTEDRPYRVGMEDRETLKVLDAMVSRKALDGNVVGTLGAHFDEINAIRKNEQVRAAGEYDNFCRNLVPAETAVQGLSASSYST